MDFIYYIFFLLVIMKKLLLNVGVYIYGISFYKRLYVEIWRVIIGLDLFFFFINGGRL